MLDIGSSELLMIIIVAVVVIGPKDLPRALYKVGQVVGKARAMAAHFRTGIDAMVREVELAELEKKWAAENQRIMNQHPAVPAIADESGAAAPQMEPLPAPQPEAVEAPAETPSAVDMTDSAAVPDKTGPSTNSEGSAA